MCRYFPVECKDDFNDCTVDHASCDRAIGCETPVADGTPCAGGACKAGACELAGLVQPCTEQGIRNAIAIGGGPYTFSCAGPTTVTTQASIVIDTNVILDGAGNLTVDGNDNHTVFGVRLGVTAELGGFTVTGGYAKGSGGGIYNLGTLTLTDSTVSGNTVAHFEDGDLFAGRGGGIYNEGTLMLTNSTVSENAVDLIGNGGGIYNYPRLGHAGTLTMTNSTVSGNTSAGIYNLGTLTMTNSVVDGNCSGRDITSNGYNIESPGNTCGFDTDKGDQVDVTEEQLNLGPLQDNGGPTETHALLPGSVAIDVIPADMCEVDDDQRGEPRPGGAMCDVGAFEVQP